MAATFIPERTTPKQDDIYRVKAAREQKIELNVTNFPTNDQLWFTPRTVIAYNYTGSWFKLIDYGIYIPPNVMGIAISLPESNGRDTMAVALLAPPGRTQPALPADNEQCVLWWYEDKMPPTPISTPSS